MLKTEEYIRHTVNWIEQVVVKHNFCPFAAKVLVEKNMDFEVVNRGEEAYCLEQLIRMVFGMEREGAKETAFLILPEAFGDFDDYLDFLSLAEELLIRQGYEGIFQIASFHPKYQFEGTSIDDPANYTNRSPYPMLQLLREASIDQALQHYENPELIPERNMEKTRTFGLEKMKEMREKSIQ